MGATNEGRFEARDGAAAKRRPSAQLPEGLPDRPQVGDPQPSCTTHPRPSPRGFSDASGPVGCGGRRPSPAHLRQVRPGGSGPPRGGGDPLRGGRLSLRSGGGGFVSPLGSELPQKRFKKGSIGCKNRPKSVQKRPSRSRRKAGPGHGIPRGGNFCQPTLPVLTGRLRCRPAHIRRLCSGRLLSAHCLQLL